MANVDLTVPLNGCMTGIMVDAVTPPDVTFEVDQIMDELIYEDS